MILCRSAPVIPPSRTAFPLRLAELVQPRLEKPKLIHKLFSFGRQLRPCVENLGLAGVQMPCPASRNL